VRHPHTHHARVLFVYGPMGALGALPATETKPRAKGASHNLHPKASLHEYAQLIRVRLTRRDPRSEAWFRGYGGQARLSQGLPKARKLHRFEGPKARQKREAESTMRSIAGAAAFGLLTSQEARAVDMMESIGAEKCRRGANLRNRVPSARQCRPRG
jgi:hypothetical protein